MTSTKYSVLVADDEPAARRGVRQLLQPYPQFAVVGECRHGAEVLRALAELRPHAIFLDIQMPGIDGFEVVRRQTPERMPALIFLTAYDDYAVQAFEAHALDYLVKPVAEARFATTMRRLLHRLRSDAPQPGTAGIVVTTAHGASVIPIADIHWIESADNYARLWVGTRSYLVRESLDSLQQRVAPHGFVRAHRQALVRFDAIRELTCGAAGGPHVLLATGHRVRVSRRRIATLRRAMRAHAGRSLGFPS